MAPMRKLRFPWYKRFHWMIQLRSETYRWKLVNLIVHGCACVFARGYHRRAAAPLTRF